MKCCSTISNSFPYIQQTFVFHVQISFVLFITILLLFSLSSSERFLIPFTISSRKSTKILVILSKNKSNKKNFHARLKQTNHLAHPKNFLYLPKKSNFWNKNTFQTAWKNQFFTQRKNVVYLPEKHCFFSQRKLFL